MAFDKEYFENVLRLLKFTLQDGREKKYIKKYPFYNDYIIEVNFDNETIGYDTREDNAIMVSNRSTSNFDQAENIVVLECVDRLLSQGYRPETIELEHSWPSGHGTSGRLDIMVKKDGVPYLMLECKTYGKKFEEEKANMLQTKKVGSEDQPKGQLFSYCFQEKSTEYLCLYASKILDNTIKYENAIIPVDESWKTLSNQKELFDHWNKQFKKNGIFDEGIRPYNIECKALLRGDLEKITNEDSSRIFNQFLEILRHNTVSDKPNAFNKILNLFICKIVDEEKADTEELQFQWRDDSTYISLQSNLEELYKQGMRQFLDIEITDYSDEEIERNLLYLDDSTRAIVKRMFQELRLQKSSEFAFKEVFNEESFEENAKVLKEIVQLLQPYQFRYGHKQQFLGNFFEQLLNTSIKQESGQFFTPVPIARFMISSLPVKETIGKNISSNNRNVLPVAIDYACGSGHFLTEYMDVLQGIINGYDTAGLGKTLKNKIEKWKQSDNEDETQGEFEWAKDCVYGIEKDYRLVKTAKISTFLNGDGEANIIHADGLDKFTSKAYKGLLCASTNSNNNFDFVIANPPYSVSAFKQTLSADSTDFDTYDAITENSSEIECLFVERTNQLLKEGGCAAIILPSSIFSNTGVLYEKTRAILLKNFYIRAIAKMGQNTFMKTGTNTVIVFIEKRPSIQARQIERLVDDFIVNQTDFSFSGEENVIRKYVKRCLTEFEYADYISYLKGKMTDKIIASEYFKALMKVFKDSADYKNLIKTKAFKALSEVEKKEKIDELLLSLIRKQEANKLLYYLLMFSNKTLIIKTGEKQQEKDFLGYEFSERKGYEGIHYYKDENGDISTSLYDDNELFESTNKVNYFVRSMFSNDPKEIPDDFKENLRYTPSYNLLTFDVPIFDTTIVLTKKEKVMYNCDSMPLGKCCEIKIGGTPPRKNHAYFTGDNLWVSIAEMNGQVIIDTKEKITDEGVNISNVKLVKKGTTLLSFKLSIGKVAMAGKDLYTNEAIAALEIRDEYKESILDEYLFYLFGTKVVDIEGDTKAFGESLNSTTLGDIIIPIIGVDEQKKFIKECKELEEKRAEKEEEISIAIEEMQNYIEKALSGDFEKVLLGDENYLSMKRGPFGGDLKKEIFVSSGYKVYEQKHAIRRDVSLGRYYITTEKYNSMEAFHVKPKDIIMSCSGTIGKFALIPEDAEPGVINQALLRFRATDLVIPEYLLICLEEVANNFNRHGLGLQNLSSVDSLKPIKIPVPKDKKIQQAIVDDVAERTRRIDCLKFDKYRLLIEQHNSIRKYL